MDPAVITAFLYGGLLALALALCPLPASGKTVASIVAAVCFAVALVLHLAA